MKMFLSAQLLLSALLVSICGPSASAQEVLQTGGGKTVRTKNSDSGPFTAVSEQGVLRLAYQAAEGQAGATFIGYYVFPARVSGESRGISFEMRSRTPGVLFSVMTAENPVVLRGYEATVLTAGPDWQPVEIRWESFVQNHKPWDSKATHRNRLSPEPASLTHLAFGRGNQMHTDYPEAWDVEIRSLRPLLTGSELPDPELPTQPLSHSRRLLEKGEPLNILLLGDSITMQGEDRTYAHQVASVLQQRFGSTVKVVNAGVGGHSVRGGRLVLARSLRAMPNPDLVFVMYGANDAKAVPIGLTAEIFQQELEALLDDLRRQSGSSPDVVLLSGVPRVDRETRVSEGSVEPIVEGVRKAALSRKALFVDTFSVYTSLSPEERDPLYKDTVHPTAEGQSFLGELVLKRMLEELSE